MNNNNFLSILNRPVVSVIPVTPVIPVITARPVIPAITERPVIPSGPAIPTKPVIPVGPAITARPVITAAPAITAGPAITAAPAIPAVTGKPTIAAITGFPVRPTIPTLTEATATLKPVEFGESLVGFLTIEDQEQSSSLLDKTFQKDSFFGIIPAGAESLITVQEQGSLTGKRQLTIPSGAILAIYTTQDGSKITNFRNGLFSTSSSTIVLAPATTFMIMLVDSTGFFYIEKVLLVTTTTVEITMPVRSMLGTLEFNSGYFLTSFGGMPFGSHNMYWKSKSTTFRSFGIIFSQNRDYKELVLRSNIDFSHPDFKRFLSGIMPLGSFNVEEKYENLPLVNEDLFAIIPFRSRGIVRVDFNDAVHDNYFVSPNSMFAVKVAGSTVIEHLTHGYFITERTVLSFPAGSVIYVMKVNLQTMSLFLQGILRIAFI